MLPQLLEFLLITFRVVKDSNQPSINSTYFNGWGEHNIKKGHKGGSWRWYFFLSMILVLLFFLSFFFFFFFLFISNFFCKRDHNEIKPAAFFVPSLPSNPHCYFNPHFYLFSFYYKVILRQGLKNCVHARTRVPFVYLDCTEGARKIVYVKFANSNFQNLQEWRSFLISSQINFSSSMFNHDLYNLFVNYYIKVRPCHKGSVIALAHARTLPNERQEHDFSPGQLKLLKQITLAIFTCRKYFFKVQRVPF